MERSNDVKLQLGFHCVVNRSPKNIEEGMSQEELWQKEVDIFRTELSEILTEMCGTPRLMSKVAQIQEKRVDKCLPGMREAVQETIKETRKLLEKLPVQVESEAECLQLLNSTVSQIRKDVVKRARGEFIGSDSDAELTIAPMVAKMVQDFKQMLRTKNPKWLETEMIEKVEKDVKNFVSGHTVDNLTGKTVFVSLFRATFIESGLLKDIVTDLVHDVAKHLRKVVQYLIQSHAANDVLSNRLEARMHVA